MIHVAFEENRRAITMIWLMTLFHGNLHFARNECCAAANEKVADTNYYCNKEAVEDIS